MRALARSIAVLALALGVVGAPAAASAAGVKVNPWHVAAQLALGTEDTAVSCPSTSLCWAIEDGQLLRSATGGATWTQQTALVPSGVAALNDLDCASTTRCLVTATHDDGTPAVLLLAGGSLTPVTAPGTVPLPSITCTSNLRCLTTDGTTVYVTVDGGATWTPHTLPSIVYTRPAIDCVAHSQTCFVVGDRGETPLIERTLNSGQTWTLQTAPGDTDGLYDVACPTATTCYGGGADFSDRAVVIRTVDAGLHWTFADVPGQAYAYRSVSCAAVTSCTAVGQGPGNDAFVSTTTDGQTWTARSVTPVATDQPAQVACPSATQCAIVAGGIGYATTDGGADWAEVVLPTASAAPSGLTCATTKICVGVGSDSSGRAQVLTTSDGGITWTEHALPDGTGALSSVDCPTATSCYAVAHSDVPGTFRSISQALRSTDGGVSWRLGRITNRSGVLGRVTCPSATTCIAGGFDNHSAIKLVRTTDSGRTWAPFAAPSGFYLDGFGCSSVTSCVIVTNDSSEAPMAWTTDDLGVSYEAHPMPDTDIYDVDCNAQLCVGVGSDGGSGAISTSTDAGVTWTASTVPPTAQLVGRVSCGSGTSCAASSYDFDFDTGGPVVVGTVNAGATWRAFKIPARHEAPIAIACRSTACIASDVSTTGNPIILAGRA